MYAQLAKKIVQFRGLILAFFAVIALLGFSRLPELRFDFTPQQLFKSDSSVNVDQKRFVATFGREDNLLFVLLTADDVYRPEVMSYLRDLTLAARTVTNVKAADSIVTMEIPRPSPAGGLAMTPLCPLDDKVTDACVSALKKLVSTEPLVRGQAVSEDGTASVLLVWIDDDIQDVKLLHQAVLDLRQMIDQSEVPDGVKLELAGIPHFRQDIVESLKHEQSVLIPLTGLAYVLILIVLFRRWSGVLLPLFVVGITCSVTLAMLVLTNSPINIINNILPSLIFIVAVSDSIHMLVRDAEEIEGGETRTGAILKMVQHTGVACLLTSTTTAVGFFSLLSADTDILQELGWQAGVSVLVAYAVTLVFLPAALTYMRPVRRESLKTEGHQPFLERGISRFGEHLLDRPWRYVAGSLFIAAVAAWLASGVIINTILMEVYDEDHPTFQRMKLIERKLGGVLPVEVMLETDVKDAFKSPDYFSKLRDIEEFAAEDRVTLSTQSLVGFHQAARVALLGSEEERSKMPDSREQVEQIQMLVQGPPDSKLGPNRYITSDFSTARVLIRVVDAGAIEQIRFGSKLQAYLDEIFPPELKVRTSITGDAYVASLSLHSFITDLFYSLLLAVLIIFGMMTFVFRSFKLGLVSVLPNTLPLLVTFGYMGARGIDLNTSTIITFAISLGLAVDDTIHFVARFQEELRSTHDVRQAVLNAITGAGRAIMLTSVLLLVGLSILLMSDFVPTRMFGTLTAITIFGALIGDLVLLPALLYLVFRGDEDPTPTMDV